MGQQFLYGVVISLGLSAIPAWPQAGGTAHAKTAAEAYHNIQVLKDIPADQVVPAMQFITYSLGVECSYCHVEGALEKDDKKPKRTARRMMQMMAAINRDNFESSRPSLALLPRGRAPGATPMIAPARRRSPTHQQKMPELQMDLRPSRLSPDMWTRSAGSCPGEVGTRQEKERQHCGTESAD